MDNESSLNILKYEKPELVDLSIHPVAMGACVDGSSDGSECTVGANYFGDEPGGPPGW